MSRSRPGGSTVVLVVLTVVAAAVDALFVLGMKYPHRARFGDWVLPTWAAAGVVLGAAALLLARRRAPLAVFAAMWLLACGTLLVQEWLFFACLTVALYVVAATSARRVAATALAACAVPLGIQAYFTRPPAETLLRLGIFAIIVGVVWGLGRTSYAAVDRLRRSEERSARDTREAVEQERLRFGRELHDIVSHTVSVMTLQAAGARTLVGRDDDRVVGSLDVIEQAGVQAMNELSRLLTVMRSEGGPDVETTAVQPRVEDLPRLVEQARASGQVVELALAGEPGRLDPSVALACYRIVQEALTNARKHAGSSALVRVSLTWVPPRLVVTVLNEAGGSGAVRQELSTGHGLSGLRERVDLVGGEFESGPTSAGGYRVRAELPVAATGTLHGEPQPDADEQTWVSFD